MKANICIFVVFVKAKVDNWLVDELVGTWRGVKVMGNAYGKVSSEGNDSEQHIV